MNIKISYNDKSFCLENNNNNLIIYKDNNKYFLKSSLEKYNLIFTYKNIEIFLQMKNSQEILLLYVILQYIYNVKTIKELYKCEKWNYNFWNIKINSKQKLSDHLILLNCFLNLKEDFNKPLNISKLENEYNLKIKDKRGLGGERPRELYYKYGFPYFTSSTKKYLKNGQRLFKCPFPIENINPNRKAIIENNNLIKKCFTCGIRHNEKNIFGNVCKFEKGHLIPILCKQTKKSYRQCKWYNTFYKDKIIWNYETNKIKFNYYAIIRDMNINELKKILYKLGFNKVLIN